MTISMFSIHTRRCGLLLLAMGLLGAALSAGAATLDPAIIGKAAGTTAKAQPDGAVKIGWMRTDVAVTVDGMHLSPPRASVHGLRSRRWATARW
jgi:hypothetical protein